MRLDEILAKWRGLMRIRENATTVSMIAVVNAEDDLFDFYAEHGTRLLAVAEAAAEMRHQVVHSSMHVEARCCCARCAAIRAFDRAARGDE